MVNITSLLDPQVITIGLDASNKHDVIVKLAKILKKANYVENVDLFVKDIYLRENEGITGIGQGIAIPHGKSNDVKKDGIAIGILKHSIEWESLDDEKVKIVILFAVSNNVDSARNQLKLLSIIAGRLGNEQVIKDLKKAKSIDEVIKAFIK